MKNIEQYKEAILSGNKVFNISEIARYIGMDISGFTKAIKGQNGANGKPVQIPERCESKLLEYFKDNNIKIKKALTK